MMARKRELEVQRKVSDDWERVAGSSTEDVGRKLCLYYSGRDQDWTYRVYDPVAGVERFRFRNGEMVAD